MCFQSLYVVTVVKKALAYVVRGDELLVFRHVDFPEAGLQVPAGTIEEGEAPDSAVIREVSEESGLTSARVVSLVGMYRHVPEGQKCALHERYVYHLEFTGETPSHWNHVESCRSDGGPPVSFRFYWIKLNDPDLNLAGSQGDLLEKLIDNLS